MWTHVKDGPLFCLTPILVTLVQNSHVAPSLPCVHNVYSLLIEKDICDCWNVSIKLPCVCVCLSSGDLFTLSVKVSYFLCYLYFSIFLSTGSLTVGFYLDAALRNNSSASNALSKTHTPSMRQPVRKQMSVAEMSNSSGGNAEADNSFSNDDSSSSTTSSDTDNSEESGHTPVRRVTTKPRRTDAHFFTPSKNK